MDLTLISQHPHKWDRKGAETMKDPCNSSCWINVDRALSHVNSSSPTTCTSSYNRSCIIAEREELQGYLRRVVEGAGRWSQSIRTWSCFAPMLVCTCKAEVIWLLLVSVTRYSQWSYCTLVDWFFVTSMLSTKTTGTATSANSLTVTSPDSLSIFGINRNRLGKSKNITTLFASSLSIHSIDHLTLLQGLRNLRQFFGQKFMDECLAYSGFISWG